MSKLNLSFLLTVVAVVVIFPIFASELNRRKDEPFWKDVRGPNVVSTKGQPWPKPQLQRNYGDTFMIVRPGLFKFQVIYGNEFQIRRHTCDLLEEALKRYYSIILRSNGLEINPISGFTHNMTKGSSHRWKGQKDFSGYLDVVNIDLLAPCEDWPHDEMDESYEIKINTPDYPGEGMLVAPSNWGILRALETFSQLLHPTEDLTALQAKSVLLVDYPRFGYRCLLLDSARHFLSKKVLFQNLDLMAMNKLNVFHWHIVDDQSFPYQSAKFPALSDKGAYRPYTHVYTRQDIHDIVEYARLRGIRVIPEFDSPGHTQSWGIGQPGLLTTCYNKKTGLPDGKYGPIDPISNSSYAFLQEFFKEVAETFPDKFLHLGGDEVDPTCWESNPQILDFMKLMNYSQNFNKLEEFYFQKLVDIVRALPQNKSYLVWQEVFDNHVKLDPSTIIHVWKSENISSELFNVTSKGYRTLLSSCWYLNYITYGDDWTVYYKCDPHHFNGTLAQKKLVLGGGPAMWGEMVDSTNLIPRLWPRASAPAERLWSAATVTSTREAAPRLEEHRCRLLKRGFNVQPPNGPGFCDLDWDKM